MPEATQQPTCVATGRRSKAAATEDDPALCSLLSAWKGKSQSACELGMPRFGRRAVSVDSTDSMRTNRSSASRSAAVDSLGSPSLPCDAFCRCAVCLGDAEAEARTADDLERRQTDRPTEWHEVAMRVGALGPHRGSVGGKYMDRMPFPPPLPRGAATGKRGSLTITEEDSLSFEQWEAQWRRVLEAMEAEIDAFMRRQAVMLQASRPSPQAQHWRSSSAHRYSNPKPSARQAHNGRNRHASQEGGGHAGPTDEPCRRPSAATAHSAAHAEERFRTWAEYDREWSAWAESRAPGAPLRCLDVPWASERIGACGFSEDDSAAEKKKKLHKALLRWHPDKWALMLECVADARERERIGTKLGEITRRILSEKAAAGL